MLNQTVNPFKFSDTAVRTSVSEEEVYFCAKDVCEVLNISWSGRGNTLRSIPEKWVMVSYHETIKGERETIFITEPAVYKLAFRSNKPEAEEFTDWVCQEVLPQLRKQGSYGILSTSQRLKISQRIEGLTASLPSVKNRFHQKILIKELHSLSNIVGYVMPDLKELEQEPEQFSLLSS